MNEWMNMLHKQGWSVQLLSHSLHHWNTWESELPSSLLQHSYKFQHHLFTLLYFFHVSYTGINTIDLEIVIIIIIIIYLSWSWATCWPVPVSHIQKYQWYICFIRNGGNAIPKHASPEAKGSNPTTGLTLLWARNPFRGNFNHWQVSRKEARQIFFKQPHGNSHINSNYIY